MFSTDPWRLSTSLLEVFLQHRLCSYFILFFIITRCFSVCCYSFLISGHRNCSFVSSGRAVRSRGDRDSE